MAKFALVLAVAVFVAALGAFDDFEAPALSGWGTWCDAKSVKPQLTLVNDAAVGTQSMKVVFSGTESFGGINHGRLVIPPDADALAFYLKPVAGNYPSTLLLETETDGPGGRPTFKADIPAAKMGEWTKITLPLTSFAYAFTKNGPQKSQELDRTQSFNLVLIAYRQPGGTFLLDNVKWGKTNPAPAVAKVDQTGKNLLRFDTSFESGPAGWMYYRSDAPLTGFSGDGASGKRCLELSSREGNNWVRSGDLFDIVRAGQPYVISFYARAVKGQNVRLSLLNIHWRYLAGQTFNLTNEWRRCTLAVPPQTKDEIVYLAAMSDESDYQIRLDNFMLEAGTVAGDYRPSEPIFWRASTGQPGEVVRLGEPLQYQLDVFNAALPVGNLVLQARLGDQKIYEQPLQLPPTNSDGIAMPVDFAQNCGYYPVRFTLLADGNVVKEEIFPFAVVPVVTVNDPFFGVSANYVPHQAVERAGAAWTRGNSPAWQAAAVAMDQVNLKKPTQGRLKQLYTITDLTQPPAWVKKDGLLPADANDLQPYLAVLAREYGESAGAFELQNEPDLTMVRDGVTLAAAAKFLAGALQITQSELKTTGKPLALNISGVGKPFAEAVFAQNPGSFDVLAVHPYTYPRYLGPKAGYCSSPEDGKLRDNLLDYVAMIERYQHHQQLWIGELGFGLDIHEPFDGKAAETFAAYVARSLLLARTVPQVKHVIWFNALGDLERDLYEYGLWRNQNGIKPLPAVAAFATVAAMLNGADHVELILDQEVKIVRWQTPGKVGYAVWCVKPKTALIKHPLADVLVVDGYGKPCGNELTIGVMPQYVTGEASGQALIERQLLTFVGQSEPYRVQSRLVADDRLELAIFNQTPDDFNGVIRLGGQSIKAGLPSQKTTALAVGLTPKIADGGEERVLTIGENAQILSFSAMLQVPYVKNFDWQNADRVNLPVAVTLDRREDIQPPDPTVNWTGPADLSAKVVLTWDDAAFYLIAAVADDKSEPAVGKEPLWHGDCLQIAFDGGNDAVKGQAYDQNDYEFGFALGHPAWCYQRPGNDKTHAIDDKILVKITREGDFTVYRAAIPWSEISAVTPVAGRIAGFNLAVTDRDDKVCNYHLEWSGGLSPYKDPSRFHKIKLAK